MFSLSQFYKVFLVEQVCMTFLCICHYEVFGSSLQQPHQHHVFRAHFDAEPHIQAEVNK